MIAADTLLPGDPALAMALARHLVDAPVMANHAYGLWGYTGETPAGRELTVQSTGIGGTSAAVVLGELSRSGTRRAIRIGAARALDPALAAGDVLVVEAAVAADGASRALGETGTTTPDPELSEVLAIACGREARRVTVVSADLDLGATPAEADGAAAFDLETAAVLTAARRAGVAAAAALLVSGSPGAVEGAEIEPAMLALGEACCRALAAS